MALCVMGGVCCAFAALVVSGQILGCQNIFVVFLILGRHIIVFVAFIFNKTKIGPLCPNWNSAMFVTYLLFKDHPSLHKLTTSKV